MSRYNLRNGIKITNYIKISQPRSPQKCLLCNEEIGSVGIIFRLGHKTFNAYTWIHINCLDKLEPGKCNRKYINLDIPTLGLASTSECSFCSKKGTAPLYNYFYFYLHPECISKTIKMVKLVCKKEMKNIIAAVL